LKQELSVRKKDEVVNWVFKGPYSFYALVILNGAGWLGVLWNDHFLMWDKS
jgi:hypothetical protein